MEELSSHALPLMWDDVSNVAQLESIAVMCYNRVIMNIIFLIFLEVMSLGLSLRFQVARGIHLMVKEANSWGFHLVLFLFYFPKFAITLTVLKF